MIKLFANKYARYTETPAVALSDGTVWNEFFRMAGNVTGGTVTEEKALGVIAIWRPINVISGQERKSRFSSRAAGTGRAAIERGAHRPEWRKPMGSGRRLAFAENPI